MTNIEKIKLMSVNELAEFIYYGCYDCRFCPCDKYDYKECYEDNCDCIGIIAKWLKSNKE